ncbi:hypothetical protein GCM10020367_69930 [Streptomyces sannanensis]|uniref:Uncharacterized protein n=1 Tax=Streptomyces sannanensis TaxID=285536 RepID=A0ABP6SNV7_9ACTN
MLQEVCCACQGSGAAAFGEVAKPLGESGIAAGLLQQGDRRVEDVEVGLLGSWGALVIDVPEAARRSGRYVWVFEVEWHG